jgi:ankyrin repeat protein
VFSPDVALSRFLLQAGASPSYSNGHLSNAPILSIFVDRGEEEMVNLLLEYGADVDGPNSEGVTPLMFAAMKGYTDLVRILLETGTVVNRADRSDQCALVYAARSGHLSVVEHLVSCDWPEPRKRDIDLGEATQQALIAAASSGRFQVGGPS